MSDRESALEDLATRLRGYDGVSDAFIAKSFTDRHLILDLEAGAAMPPEIRELLAEYDLRGSNAEYDTEADDPSYAGDLDDGTRHQFVDTRTRGDHQSSVVD